MSNAIRTTSGAIEVSQLAKIGMVTIRADLADSETCSSIKKITGLDVPETRKITGDSQNGLAWMSPDDLMLFCDNPTEQVAKLSPNLSGHSMVVDVSHARAVFALNGKGSREVLAKGAPIDLSVDGFTIHDFRRTRLGQVAVALWMENDAPEQFGLICFASVQDFIFEWLTNAASKSSLPGYFAE